MLELLARSDKLGGPPLPVVEPLIWAGAACG